MERRFGLVFILVAAAWLRMLEPLYSTAYMDESIYIVYGRMFLSGRFESPLSTPLQWSFGWYLWPAMTAIADRIGGMLAVRELSAVLGVATVAAVYGLTRRIFSAATGLAAAAVMAVIAPAILVSRIATRDSGSIAFFALGLWAFTCAWQEEKKKYWLLTAASLFAAFLCKYLVAVYFPFLVLLALKKGRRPFLLFSLPLFLACAAYGLRHYHDLAHLLSYGAGYTSLRAPAGQARLIYLSNRLDFWLMAAAALPAVIFRRWRVPAFLLLGASVVILLVQWKTRADFDYWKHVNYALLFLVPVAAAGVVLLAENLWKENHYRQMLGGLTGVVVLAAAASWLGKATRIDEFVFWPNVGPVLAWSEGRLTGSDRILADDTVLRYYFHPPLRQDQIVDPMYFEYRGETGEAAYSAAVREGAFNYIVLDGGIGEEARRMDAAIRPLLGGYELQMSALEPTLGHQVEIYARPGAAPMPEGSAAVRLLAPASNSVVVAKGMEFAAEGTADGAGPGWHVQLEVFTDRWYLQGGNIPVAADGAFRQTVVLGGQGRQQCYHLLRARLFDAADKPRAVTINFAVARANPDGSAPACRAGP